MLLALDSRLEPAGARTCAICAVLLGSMGTLALAGWLSGRLVLASGYPSLIPMAPLTALAFIVLALVFLRLRLKADRDLLAAAVGAFICALGCVRLMALVSATPALPDVEAMLVRDAGSFGGVPLARISPITAAGLALTGAAVVLLSMQRGRWRIDAAGWLSATVALTGCVVLLGYAYGTPLLYGGSVIPVALPSGFGLLLAGVATLGLAGPDARPIRVFCQHGARARLLRAFLPGTMATVLVAGAAVHLLVYGFKVNPALAAALAALAAAGLAAIVVWRNAGVVGLVIDRAEETLTRARDELETAVAVRTAELARINEELEAFASSVSHDLRAPLRHMTGFAELLERSCGEEVGPQGLNYTRQIVAAGGRMSRLIDDLLAFARTAQAPVRSEPVDLSTLVREVIADTSRDLHGRTIEWQLEALPVVSGDRALLRQALTNLIANAIKYTRTRDRARIHIGTPTAADDERVFYVRDNGVGFDMTYAGKLFGVFQRLHRDEQFEGTGIGLANVRRIIQRHGGRVWAEAALDRGATFFVSLPSRERTQPA
jgi:signal transduction histidine kinase